MKAEIENVAPEAAEQWLRKLPKGMKINRGTVKVLIDLLKTGRWTPTHQGVVFAKDGSLLSGAEILAAISESQVSAHVKVSRDEDSATLPFYGRGRPRSAGDVLKAVCRVKAASAEAQVLSAFITHALGGNAKNPLQVEAAHHSFDNAITEVAFAKVPVSAAAFWRNSSKAAVALGLAGTGYREKVRGFVAELFDRREASRATLTFRRRLNEELHRLSPREVFDRTLCAIAAHCEIPDADNPDSVRNFLLSNARAKI